MKNFFLPLFAMGLGVVSLASASAQIITSVSTSPPPAPHVVSQPKGDSGNWAWNASRPYMGQSFQASSNATLGNVTVRVAQVGGAAANTNFTLSIYQSTSRTSIGTAIASESGQLPGEISVNDYLTFQFDKTVALVEGNFYTFIFSGESLPSTFLNFATGEAADLLGDRWSSTDGVSFTRNASSDLEFYITVIPEPSVVWLSAAALPLFFLLRRRMRHAA